MGLPTIIAAIALGALPPGDPPAQPKAAVKPRPAASSLPSRERRAALQSTINRRRAYRQRIRGNADRQQEMYGPYWHAAMGEQWGMISAAQDPGPYVPVLDFSGPFVPF